MPVSMLRMVESGLLPEADLEAAQDASRALARLGSSRGVHIEAEAEGQARQSFVLPAMAVRLLTDMLALLAQGRSVTVMPEDAELTTQQAAEMLNVSRPYLIKLLEAGRLPHHKVGTHRRIYLHDLAEHHAQQVKESQDALDELTREAQELGMGY